MITIKDFMETVDFKITEGSEYCWNCFGPNAYRLDSWNQEHDGHTVSIIFDTRTHEVYEACAYDYSRDRAYRLINPNYKSAQERESQERDVDFKEAWDDVRYVDLDVDEDFLEKARAIVNEEDYDTRVQLPLVFTDEELLTYMKMAHERDMTFNEFVETALKAAIDEIKLRKDLDNIQPDDFVKDKIKKKGKK